MTTAIQQSMFLVPQGSLEGYIQAVNSIPVLTADEERELAERLQQQGPNALPAAASRSMLARFLSQFNNLLIYVLLGSAVVTALLQHWVDTGVILAVVLINAVFGFVQEGRAEKALDAVKEEIPKAWAIVDDYKREHANDGGEA